MFWVRLALVLTAGLFMLDRLVGLGPLPGLALAIGVWLYPERRQRGVQPRRLTVLALLALSAVAALDLLDAGFLPVLRI